MSFSDNLKKFLLKNGAAEAGFAEISNFTPKKELNTGIVFYMTYPKEIISNCIKCIVIIRMILNILKKC